MGKVGKLLLVAVKWSMCEIKFKDWNIGFIRTCRDLRSGELTVDKTSNGLVVHLIEMNIYSDYAYISGEVKRLGIFSLHRGLVLC